MSTIKVRAFGITKDILGGREIMVELEGGSTVGHLRQALHQKYPQLLGIRSLFVAVNNQYAEDLAVISDDDEVAIIPPVSGG